MENKKFISQPGEMRLVQNDDLDCKDCIYAHSESTIDCVMYQKQKPGKIIYGGKCELKKTEIR